MTLIGYWPLNEEKGDKAYDHSGNENHGSLEGSPTQGANGVIGSNAYDFDADNNEWVESDPGSFSNGFNSFSLSAWIKKSRDSDDYNSIIARTDEDYNWNSGAFQFMVGDNQKIFVNYNDGDSHFGDKILESNQWYHVVLTWDGLKGKFWIDGQLDSTFNENANISSITDGRILLGRRSSNQLFFGRISEARIYNRVLSHSEVQYLFSVSQRGRFYSDMK